MHILRQIMSRCWIVDPRAVVLLRAILAVYCIVDTYFRLALSGGMGIEFYCSKSLHPECVLYDDVRNSHFAAFTTSNPF